MTKLGFSKARLRRIEAFLKTRYVEPGRLPFTREGACVRIALDPEGEPI